MPTLTLQTTIPFPANQYGPAYRIRVYHSGGSSAIPGYEAEATLDSTQQLIAHGEGATAFVAERRCMRAAAVWCRAWQIARN